MQLAAADYIEVDVPAAGAFEEARRLHLLFDPRLIFWEGPLASALHTAESPRRCFRGYLQTDATDLTIRMMVSRIRSGAVADSTLVGSSTLLNDQAAMLAEGSSPEGLTKVGEICEETLIINPKLALVIPTGNLDTAQKWLSTTADKDPQHCLKVIRWRQSTNGGRPWARPTRLAQDVQNSIARAQILARPGGKAAEEAASGILVTISGRRGQAYPIALKEATVAKLEEILQAKLDRGVAGKALGPMQWAEEQNGDGSWSGRIRARLPSPAEAETLHGQLHGVPILVGREWYTLSVANAFLPTFNSGGPTKNGPRGAP